jgi:hypothetical protein
MYKEIDVEETQMPKWAAAEDAQRRSAANRLLYTAEQQEQLIEFYTRVCAAYDARVYYNYRQQFMVVKVERPSKVNLLNAVVRELDYWAAQNDIDIVRTKTSVLYRIKQ